MKVKLLGTNYNQISLDELEKICFNDEKCRVFLKHALKSPYIDEIIILATCNRMEIYYVSEYEVESVLALKYMLSEDFNLEVSILDNILYEESGDKVVRHLFEVSSGTKSMVYGEQEIISQVKSAYALAQCLSTTGPYLNKLFQTAISVGKRVRDETAIGQGAYSVSSVAIDRVMHKSDDFFDQSILVLGAGLMSKRAVRKLVKLGHRKVTIANRTESSGKQLADQYQLPFIHYNQKTDLSQFDIIYFATASPTVLIKSSQRNILKDKVTVIDIGLPRNVDPNIGDESGVYLINLDSLQTVVDTTLSNRKKDGAKIQLIISESIKNLQSWKQYRSQVVSV